MRARPEEIAHYMHQRVSSIRIIITTSEVQELGISVVVLAVQEHLSPFVHPSPSSCPVIVII